MNFLIDAYDYIFRGTFFLISVVRVVDCAFYAFLIILLIEKMGGKRFLFFKLRSLNPPKESDKGVARTKKARLFTDIFFMSFFLYFTVKLPVFLATYDMGYEYVNKHTKHSYKIERDHSLQGGGFAGLTLMPYVWIPAAITINKYRQWVDPETMVTWKYHDKRRECFWSAYEDSSCGSAMIMARALYRDDESLSIGKKYAKARKKEGGYSYCSALGNLQSHAEETENVDLYKEMVKKKCEMDCRRSCIDHKWAQKLPAYRLKNAFRNRRKLSSFLSKH